MAFTTPTTELEAVNRMLAAVGETPVNTLENSGVVDAVNARTTLHNISREVQQKGWRFNTEECFPLSADGQGEVALPRNCLKLSIPDRSLKLVQRGRRLYDVANHTYAIGKTVRANMVVLLDFEDLPEPARNYITIRAARNFIDSTMGAQTLHGFEERDEMQAMTDLVRAETEEENANWLTDSDATYGVLWRGGSPPAR